MAKILPQKIVMKSATALSLNDRSVLMPMLWILF